MDPLALLAPIRSGVAALPKESSRAIHHQLQCATLAARMATALPALAKLEVSLSERDAHSPLDLDLYRNVSNLLELVETARSLVQKCSAPAIDFLGRPEDFAFEFRSLGRSLDTTKREIGFLDSSEAHTKTMEELFDESRDAREAEEDRQAGSSQSASASASAAAAAAPMWTAASAAALPEASSSASPPLSSASSSSSPRASAAPAGASSTVVASSIIPIAPPLTPPVSLARAPTSGPGSSANMVLFTARATALYDFEPGSAAAAGEEELGFTAGQRLCIEGKVDEWFVGCVEGREERKGIFPANYVELDEQTHAAAASPSALSSSSSPAASAVRTNASDPAVLASHPNLQVRDGLATALFTYEGGAGDQLPFNTGDVLLLTGEIEGWYVGRLLEGDGTIGSFPKNYVKVESMEEAQL